MNPNNTVTPPQPYVFKKTPLSEIGDELDTKDSNRKVWLIKIPEKLAQKWKQAKDNQLVGQVIVRSNDNLCIKVENTEYKMDSLAEIPATYILSKEKKPIPAPSTEEETFDTTTPATTSSSTIHRPRKPIEHFNMKLHSSVEKGYLLKMPLTMENILEFQQKVIQSNQIKRSVQVLDEAEEARSTNIFQAPSADLGTDKKLEDKAERMDEDVLRQLLFSKFAEKERWTFKELQDQLKQPQAYLKEKLNEFCDFNRSGPNRNKYELKPQYKITESKKRKRNEKEEEEEEECN